MNNKKNILLLVVIIVLLMIGITGTTYAYLMFSAKDDNTVVGVVGTADLTLDVSRVTPANNHGVMVPQLEKTLSTAVSSSYNCIDGNNNVVCQVYKLELKNVGTAKINVRGTIIFDNPAELNLKYKLMDNPTTLSTSISRYGYEDIETPLINKTSLAPNQTNTYYMVIWVDETSNVQNGDGTYIATIKFEDSELNGATSTYVNYMTNSTSDKFRSDTYREKIKNASFVNYINTTNASLDENNNPITWDMSEVGNNNIIAWLEDNNEDGFYDLYIGSPIKIYSKTLNNFFNGMKALENIEFNNLDTSLTTNMGSMFAHCTNLTSLDLSNFNTNKVTNMNYMFERCSNLTTLDLRNFDTNNVTSMAYMFRGCSNLINLDIRSFDTSKVKTMDDMFQKCNSLIELDVRNFDTSNVTSMGTMFMGCNNLTTLDVRNFDTSNVTSMSNMFAVCSNLTTLDVRNFNTSNVTNMGGMFQSCSNLTTLDLSNFDTSNVTNMEYMFTNISNLTTLDLSNFNTTSVTNMNRMFAGCTNLENLNINNFNTSKVTNMSAMFKGIPKLRTTITIRNLDVTNINYVEIFNGAATESGASIVMNYTADTSSLVDNMIATAKANSNVVKGSLVS